MKQHILFRRPRRSTRGSVLVETVLGVVVLTTFAFGIVEVGWYYRDAQILNTFARDYARDLSTGMSTTLSLTQIQNSNTVGSGLLLGNGLSSSNFTALYSTDDGATFPTTNVVTNDASGAKNSTNIGSMIMVTVTYQHSRITGLFGRGTVPMQTSSIMMRQ